ncbi:hypothetical protein KA977_12370, partial [Candidatus Dependentiae bacterium]|nr:hypothetical protein [Candidatus Dependentiae bacterium]
MKVFKYFILISLIGLLLLLTAGYFFYPYIKLKSYNYLLKRFEIQKFHISGIKITKKNLSIKKFELIKSDDFKINFSGLALSFGNYKNFLNKNYDLNDFSIKSLSVDYTDTSPFKEDTEPLNIDKFLNSLSSPFKIRCEKINIGDFNLSYRDSVQSAVIKNSKIYGSVSADSGIIHSVLSFKSNKTIDYSYSGITLKSYLPEAHISLSKSNSHYNLQTKINSNIDYSDSSTGIKIFQTRILIASGCRINLSDKKIESNMLLEFGKVINSNLKINCSYDTDLIDFELLMADNKINLTGLTQYSSAAKNDVYGLSKKLNLNIINNDTTAISYNFKTKKLGVKNLNLVFDINNFQFAGSGYAVENLKSSGSIKGSLNFDKNFNISPDFELSIKSEMSASEFFFKNYVSFKNCSLNINFSKSKKLNITKFISSSADTVSLYSISYFNNLLKSAGNFSIDFVSKESILQNKYFLSNSKITLLNSESEQNFFLKSKWKNFSVSFLNSEFLIPEGSTDISLSSNDLKIFNLKSRLDCGKIFETNFVCHSEFPDNWLESVYSGNKKNILKFYERSFIRADFSKLNCDAAKISSLFGLNENFKYSAYLISKIYFVKKPDDFPVISGNLRISECDLNIKNINLSVSGLNADLNIENYSMNPDANKKSAGTGELSFSDKSRNFNIAEIKYDNFIFSDISGNFSINQNLLYLNNVVLDLFDGSSSFNMFYDLIKKRMSFKAKINNSDLNRFFYGAKYSGNKIPVSATFDLSMRNAFSDTKTLNINNIDAVLTLTSITKETILSIINFTDPQNNNPNSSKLKFALKYAEPVSAKIALYSGMLNLNIGFNSKLIKEFTID